MVGLLDMVAWPQSEVVGHSCGLGNTSSCLDRGYMEEPAYSMRTMLMTFSE
jgi:hypothetical protein